MDVYKVLNIPKEASPEEIRKAYKDLVKKWHPDKHPPSTKPVAEARFKDISQAYNQALRDQDDGVAKRRNRGEENLPGSRPKPPPVERKLECTLEELCRGCKKEVTFTRDVVDKDGLTVKKQETQTIRVKPGWKKGTKITFEGMGDERLGRPPADVVYSISEKEHRHFKRAGNDLMLKVEVPLVNALTGWTFSFRLLGGQKIRCRFSEEIIYPGFEKVIKGQGMPIPNEKGKKGDLRIKFHIIFPQFLSETQRTGIAEILSECPSSSSQSY